jgi:hypothetical protein
LRAAAFGFVTALGGVPSLRAAVRFGLAGLLAVTLADLRAGPALRNADAFAISASLAMSIFSSEWKHQPASLPAGWQGCNWSKIHETLTTFRAALVARD